MRAETGVGCGGQGKAHCGVQGRGGESLLCGVLGGAGGVCFLPVLPSLCSAHCLPSTSCLKLVPREECSFPGEDRSMQVELIASSLVPDDTFSV